jgi:hypothetical protein
VTSVRLGATDLLISAGREGTILGVTLARDAIWNSRRQHDERFKIEIGDRISSIATLRNGNVVAATEEGFLLFQLSPERWSAAAQTT